MTSTIWVDTAERQLLVYFFRLCFYTESKVASCQSFIQECLSTHVHNVQQRHILAAVFAFFLFYIKFGNIDQHKNRTADGVHHILVLIKSFLYISCNYVMQFVCCTAVFWFFSLAHPLFFCLLCFLRLKEDLHSF